jgi:hypothetical protein
MTTRFVAATVLLLGGIVVSEPLLACGEKFLIPGRGSRFQRAAPKRTAASILIYANPSLNLPKALQNLPYDTTQRKAGYHPTTVTSRQDFDNALGRGGWDLVLVDYGDRGAVPLRAPSAKAPTVLPVVFNATKAEEAAAKKQHPRILKAPIKSQSFLNTIDDAIAERQSAQHRAEGSSLR